MSELLETINSVVFSKAGHLMTSRLNKQYFEKIGKEAEWDSLVKNDLTTAESIYILKNPDVKSECECGADLVFIGYSSGFRSQKCFKCSRLKKGQRYDRLQVDSEQLKPDIKNISLETIKIDYLLNKNGKLEGQRISEGWFTSRGLIREFDLLANLGIRSSKDIYDHENPKKEICECGSKKRFLGYRDGYKEYCEPCGRSKNNWTKNTESNKHGIIVELDDLVDFISDGNGGYSSSKIMTLSNATLEEIKSRTSYMESARLSERIYHIEHKLTKYPICESCYGENKNFYTSKVGYKPGCSTKCNFELVDYDARTIKSRTKLYNFYVEKYSDLDSLGISNDHTIELFSREEYIYNSDPVINIEHSCGTKYTRSLKYQGSLQCPSCFPVRSKSQYEVLLFIQTIISPESILYDKRLTLNGLELDIEIKHHNIAIEYDGIMFHSFGKNAHTPFNNFADESLKKGSHLDKTEKCEELGIQLFHIFSNEWETKQDIWKSVLNNALGKSEKIYARKTEIREVTNKEAKTFQELNHLQGPVNSSVKLGLYYNNELVSLMTFSKSRYDKKIDWELMRFCNKLNFTVVGGASKLLKHFERTYNPRSLISYANRRWSQGNLYNSLGLEFTHSTKPGYFYFKTGTDVLESRVKFQKHKLVNILDEFNPELTESENMYNNNYRKIYDCGNNVYIKNYELYPETYAV